MTKDEALAEIHAVCPECKAGTNLRRREDTKEWVHDHLRTNTETRTTQFSHMFCLAHDLRVKYQDVLNG